MSALSFAAFCAELAIGYVMTHPAPFFVALGVAGAAGVFAVAARFMARDDMPLSLADQATVDVFAELAAELHHDRPVTPAPALTEHAPARHARPPAWRRLAGRIALRWRARRALAPAEAPPQPLRQAWGPAALARQIHALPPATTRLALPAPQTGDGPASPPPVTTSPGPGSEPSGVTGPAPAADVPGRAPATATQPGPPPLLAREGCGAGPAGDTGPLDYADDVPFKDWLRDSVVMAAVGREGT